jgi:hypothetical protein
LLVLPTLNKRLAALLLTRFEGVASLHHIQRSAIRGFAIFESILRMRANATLHGSGRFSSVKVPRSTESHGGTCAFSVVVVAQINLNISNA